jgi:hypothetical protein
MKKVLPTLFCAVLLGGCATYSFHYDGDPSLYSEFPIEVTAADGQKELSANGDTIGLVKSERSASGDTVTMRDEYAYTDESGESESAVISRNIYKVVFPNSSPVIITKGEISLANPKKTIASTIRSSDQDAAYITFVRDRKFAFGKYFGAVDAKGKVVKSKNSATALTATIDGEEVGYIVPGKEPKLIFRNDRELPSELFRLSLVVYASYAME